MFVTFWAPEPAGSATEGPAQVHEKINYGLVVGNHIVLGGNGLCCASSGTAAGEGYGAGRTLRLKQHILLSYTEELRGLLLIVRDRVPYKKDFWVPSPVWGCFALLAAGFPHNVRANRAPFDKLWKFLLPEEGGEPTVPLLSDPPPPPAAALGIRRSCDSEDPKKEPLLPSAASAQSCAPTENDSEHLGGLKPFDFWKIFRNCLKL